MKRVSKIFLIIFFLGNLVYANENYFTKPLNIVVTFGKGGSTDKMARIVAKFIEKEIKQKVNIINIKGDGTHKALNFFLSKPQNGYYILASAFPYYLINNINTKKTNYNLDDFSILNLQWFDFDFVVVNKESKISSFKQLIRDIKNGKNNKVGVIYHSSGDLLLKIILNKLNIKSNKLDIKYYHDGKSVRKALLGKELDFIVASSKGSEIELDKLIKPLLVLKSKRDRNWNAPILKEVFNSIDIDFPALSGSTRGFAVSSEFKLNYPKRYSYILEIFKKTLAKKKVQNTLRNGKIGYLWLGEKQSNLLVRKTLKFCNENRHLFDTMEK